MMNKSLKTEEQMINEAIKYMSKYHETDSTGHDYHHVMRVLRVAIDLSQNYEVDLLVVSLAAILHDLDDPKIRTDSLLAKSYLSSLEIEDDRREQILEIIMNMSFSKQKLGKAVTTLEGRIVQDADRLDALGAIGIARCFAFGGSHHRPIYNGDKNDQSSIAHFYQKLLHLETLINLPEAKIIAMERTDFMKEYLRLFLKDFNELSE